jgi:hypothetical protein
LTATIRTRVNSFPIDVPLKVIIPIESRDLLCCPDREHLRTTTQDLLQSVPVDRVKEVRRDDVVFLVMLPSFLIPPIAGNSSFIGTGNLGAVQEYDKIFAGKVPGDESTTRRKGMVHSQACEFVTCTVELLLRRQLIQ